jgi:HD-GYP domain-containing protein (c-di-GMP phosphodiesterase class II)
VSTSEVVSGLAGARRAIQLYPRAHPAYQEAFDSFIAAVHNETALGPFVLNWHQGRLYHDSVVLPEDSHGTASIADAFESRGIESLTLSPTFGQDDAVALAEVLALRPVPDLDVALELSNRQATSVLISVIAKVDEEERQERDRQRQADRAMYHQAIMALSRVRQLLASGGADLSETGGFVSNVMERMFADPAAVMGLATLRGSQDGDLYHSLNVMIYTLALGQRLGLPDEGLVTLGLSALMHDVGKGAFIADDPAQAEPMRLMHPKVGAEILQRVAMDDPAPMLVAYEHHMQPDSGGYPERESTYVAHPYSRMVAIANRYDNLTNPGSAHVPLTPDRAIVRVLQEGGTVLDPFFTRLFANALGVFPVGCLVRLSDHSVGVVVSPGEDPLAPVVRLSFDDRGAEVTEQHDIDLAVGEVRIVEVISPESLNVDVSEKL